MKIVAVEAQLLHANGQTDRHDEANSRFSQFCEKRLKTCRLYSHFPSTSCAVVCIKFIVEGVPLATEPDIPLIILAPMKILQRNRHTLQTHSSSFLTQRTYPCSNFVAISSLVLELLKEYRVR